MMEMVPNQLHQSDTIAHQTQTIAHQAQTTSGGSDNYEDISDDEESPKQRPTNKKQKKKKKQHHRHTQHQIQELEALFRKYPHPDNRQRNNLGRRLGLEPLQIKFWFQNKRTQLKMQVERSENSLLRAETERLRFENNKYREVFNNLSRHNCGRPIATFDEHRLRIENARLREEIDRVSATAARCVGIPVANYPHQPLLESGAANYSSGGTMYSIPVGDHSRIEASRTICTDKHVIVEMAIAAMEELMQMTKVTEPLWMPSIDGTTTNVLNEEVYMAINPRILGPKRSQLKCEASRETAIIILNHLQLVQILMDVDQWSHIFSAIVSKTTTVEVLSAGAARTYDGVMQVVSAEYQVPSPFVGTRESYFVRYCKQHLDGTWAVLDVSLDALHPASSERCRRRPSGCIIKDLSNGYSEVTWVEHVEVVDKGVSNLYKPLVDSTLAFGAKRWLATLGRYCDRLARTKLTNIPISELRVIKSGEGRKKLFQLAERMVKGYFGGAGSSTGKIWTAIPSGNGVENVRIMVFRNVDDPGRPPGLILSAASSFWLPVPPSQIFEFLCDETTRNVWDVLATGELVQEIAHIANGHDPRSCVSIFRVKGSPVVGHTDLLILQESHKDSTGSFVIYAPVDIVAIDAVLCGNDPDHLNMLSSGFTILPDCSTKISTITSDAITLTGKDGVVVDDPLLIAGGSLVTLVFQILINLDSTVALPSESIITVKNLVGCTANNIREALLGQGELSLTK